MSMINGYFMTLNWGITFVQLQLLEEIFVPGSSKGSTIKKPMIWEPSGIPMLEGPQRVSLSFPTLSPE